MEVPSRAHGMVSTVSIRNHPVSSPLSGRKEENITPEEDAASDKVEREMSSSLATQTLRRKKNYL